MQSASEIPHERLGFTPKCAPFFSLYHYQFFRWLHVKNDAGCGIFGPVFVGVVSSQCNGVNYPLTSTGNTAAFSWFS